MIRHNGEGVKQNKYLGFTMNEEDFINCRAYVRKRATGKYDPKGEYENGIPRTVLPVEERWSARLFELSDVFHELGEEDTQHIDIDDYYDVSTWEGYRLYMKSDLDVKKPPINNWLTPSRYKKSLLDFE